MRIVKNVVASIFLLVAFSALAVAAYPDVIVLLNGAKTVAAGKAFQFDKGRAPRVAHIVLGGASASSATVTMAGSLDGTNWTTLTTFSMASSPAASMVVSANVDYPWSAMRGNITAIASVSGAAATDVSTVTLMVAE